jgi:hypothetical protein
MDDPKELQPAKRDELAWDIEFALSRHGRPWMRFKKHLDDAPRIIAKAIADHLKLANWKFFRGPPSRSHSIGGPPPDTTTEKKP